LCARPGDEQKAEFWNQFVSGDRERLVSRETAIYVVRQIIAETLGPHRVGTVEFRQGEITIGDCLDAIGHKIGPGSAAGWQRLQAKAGFKVGPGA
jgi:hypothetical protein